MNSLQVRTSNCEQLDQVSCENSYEMRCTDDDPSCSSRRCRFTEGQCTLDTRPSGCLCLTLEPSLWASEGVCVVRDGDCASAPRTTNLVSAISLHPYINYGHMQPWADSGCATNGAFFHVCNGAGDEIQNAMVFIRTNDTVQPWLAVDWLASRMSPASKRDMRSAANRIFSKYVLLHHGASLTCTFTS